MPNTTPPQTAPSPAAPEKEEKKVKSTVRKSKKNPQASTQRFLPIAEIRNSTVVLKNGGLRAILQIEALNFNLKSETEQQGIIAGYQSFLNTLTFPVQVIVQSRRVDIDPYIKQIGELAQGQTNDLLREQSNSYAEFVRQLVDVADIMQKRFYVLVPLDDTSEKVTFLSKMLKWLNVSDSSAKAVQRYRTFAKKHVHLKDRITLIESSLNNIGLTTHRMETRELIEFYYKLYNPDTSQYQKLPMDLNTAMLTL